MAVNTQANAFEFRIIQTEGKTYLNTKQAAHYLGLSGRTLEGFRHRKCGPRAYRMGRVWYYRIDDIEHWLCEVAGGAA